MTTSRGIDVSHHQGTIDWPGIRRELGLTWAACKATEGSTFRDSQFARNWPAMKAAGLVRIAYHFARPGGDAGAQARFFLDVVQPTAGDVLCLDLETSDGRTQGQVNAWAKAFAAAVRKAAPSNTLVLYLGGYAANGSGAGLSAHFDYWWFPRYATSGPVRSWPTTYAPRLSGNTTGWRAPHIWQWAASLATSEGQVDANLANLTAAQLRDGPRTVERPSSAVTSPPTQHDVEPEEAPMIVIRKSNGWWYLLAGGKLIGLYAGTGMPGVPRMTVDERQWARFLKAGLEVVL